MSFDEEPRSFLDTWDQVDCFSESAAEQHFVGELTSETNSDKCAIYPHLFKDLGTFLYLMFEDEHGF